MSYKTSDARRRDMSAELRKWRENAGLAGKVLARKMGIDPSTLSRLESGQGAFSETTIMVYLAHCGAPADEAERVLRIAKETEDGYLVRREVLRTLILHETTARSIQVTAPLLVPGLLQTEGYARAVMDLYGITDKPGIESRVKVRITRQELLKRWQPPTLTFFLYEATLRCPIGGTRVMNEQMLHLAFVSGRPQASIRIVPFDVGGIAALAGQMMLMDFADHGPVLYLEGPFAGIFAERDDDIARCRELLRRLDDVALTERHSQELLVQLASEYDQPDEGAS